MRLLYGLVWLVHSWMSSPLREPLCPTNVAKLLYGTISEEDAVVHIPVAR